MARCTDPWFVLIAGVNGSGKSTFARPETIAGLLEESDADFIEVINPDTETQRIRAANPHLALGEANLIAAVTCENAARERIAAKRGHFAIETVLSTDKYRDIVSHAIRLGWRFLFVYIVIDSVEESKRRVAFRVKHGGHDVPEDKLRKRWNLSRANMPWFWSAATSAFLFRNPPDFGEPTEAASKHAGTFIADWPPHPSVEDILKNLI
ncbi:MAG: AAA family ATPase [Pseudomonadota bacterium]|nr:AAA family ATPase [Pseudomonadota bacterium]